MSLRKSFLEALELPPAFRIHALKTLRLAVFAKIRKLNSLEEKIRGEILRAEGELVALRQIHEREEIRKAAEPVAAAISYARQTGDWSKRPEEIPVTLWEILRSLPETETEIGGVNRY